MSIEKTYSVRIERGNGKPADCYGFNFEIIDGEYYYCRECGELRSIKKLIEHGYFANRCIECREEEKRKRIERRLNRYSKFSGRATSANARAREKGVPGKLHSKDLKRRYEEQEETCAYCFKKFEGPNDDCKYYDLDHIVPFANGGSNFITNVVFTCSDCNKYKSYLDLHEWLPRHFDQDHINEVYTYLNSLEGIDVAN